MDIRKLCYALYKEDWKRSHMITHERELDNIKNYYEELVADETEYTYEHYLEDFGYDGELYVCYEEFCEAEYLDKDYITDLLDEDEGLIELYLTDLYIVNYKNDPSSKSRLAKEIVELFENLLDEKDIEIPCSNEYEEKERRHDGNTAKLYGSEYWNLVDQIESLL